jgi:hypothetical protein
MVIKGANHCVLYETDLTIAVMSLVCGYSPANYGHLPPVFEECIFNRMMPASFV